MAEDGIDDALRRATVRVLDAAKVTQGAGAVVSDRCVVTCAHVVTAAGGAPGASIAVAPLDLVREEPNAPERRITMHVSTEHWSPYGERDVAVLVVTEPLPGEFAPLAEFGPVVVGNQVVVYGFPGKQIAYEREEGTVKTDVRDGSYARFDLDAGRVRPGYSGAPIFDLAQRRPIGIVTTIKTPDPTMRALQVAYGIPASELVQVFPPLRRATTHRGSGRRELTVDERRRLVNALAACDSLRTPSDRTGVFQQLPHHVFIRILRSDQLLADVHNAVSRCEQYATGLHDLLECVRFAEDDTLAWREVERLGTELGIV